MSLHESSVELAEALADSGGAALPNGELPKLTGPEAKAERFAIYGYVLEEVIDTVVQRDVSVNGEGIKFSADLDEGVIDAGTLSAWTMEFFGAVILERCRRDLGFNRAVYRLGALSTESFRAAKMGMGDNSRQLQTPDNYNMAINGLQVDNLAKDLDGLMRRLHYVADYYGLPAPTPVNARDHLRLALADGLEMAQQSITIQDFFETLEDLMLFQDDKEIPKGEGFAVALELTSAYWTFMHREDLRNGPKTVIPGKKPKSFYRVANNKNGLLRVSPIIPNIVKLTDPIVEEERIGCAALMLKSKQYGYNPLQLALRATLNALGSIGFYDQDADAFKGLSSTKLNPVIYKGSKFFMGTGFAATLQTLVLIDKLNAR